LLLLFVGSGCAALIYEVVWFQLLQMVIGSSAISLGVLLATFMGGMCLGSFLLPRVTSPRRHPLRVYAWLEIGIGVIGILVLFGMPLVAGAYTAWAGLGVFGIVMRALAAAVCLLPPTFLMGATLPAVSRWVESTPQGMSWLGFFYAGNIGGAVLGSLLAGFYLLRVHDMATATYVAVAINAAVAFVALALADWMPHQPASTADVQVERAPWARTVYVTIALSGMTALAAEVIWTRLLSLLFGGSTYTFSLILAVFLVGLGIGSSIGSALARGARNPRAALGWCQLALCAAIAWTAYMLTQSMPYWPINPSIASSPWFNFQLDLARCWWTVLPGAILWGASFPLALAAVAAPGQDPGRLVGGVYAANTVGAIVGSLGATLAVAWAGSQRAQQGLIVFAALSALLMLAPISLFASPGSQALDTDARPADDHPQTGRDRRGRKTARAQGASGSAATLTARPGRAAFQAAGLVPLLVAALGAGLLARNVQPVPGLLVAYGRYAATRYGQADIIYTGEGVNSSVAVSRLSNGVLNYHNAGKVQASSEPQDMRLQRMLGHITTLIPERPDSVFVIGCGAGVTAGAVSIDPSVKRVTIAEIEGLVPRVVSTYFSQHNFDVVRNPKVQVRIDDARHYLLVTKEKYDAITSDPLDPWVKGAAMLYTTEFFELVKRHLNPGGVVTLFVQLYESNTEAVKSEIATFFQSFPNGIAWGNTQEGRGYDLVLMGQVEPTRIDVAAIEQRLQRPEYAPVALSLQQVGLPTAMDLFATYAGSAQDLAPWLRDAAINRDRNLRLQYLAGLGLNLYQSEYIYNDMLAYSRFPENLFVGTDAVKWGMRAAIERVQGR
jgi:spermidine synthase